MQVDPTYDDVVAEVRAFLVERAERAVAAGVAEVWIDPGLRLRQARSTHNLALLADLDALVATGFPVLVGLSRKSFLGRLVAASDAAAWQPPLPGLDGGTGRRRRARPWPSTTASRARWPRRCGPLTRARRWCGCTTCEATVDAVTLVAA